MNAKPKFSPGHRKTMFYVYTGRAIGTAWTIKTDREYSLWLKQKWADFERETMRTRMSPLGQREFDRWLFANKPMEGVSA